MCIEKTPWEQVIEFHGHTCPGIALGYRLAQIANRELGISATLDSGISVTAYTHSCALDAFQIINRATYGRKNLLVEEKKLHVYHFQNVDMSKKILITVHSEILEQIADADEPLSPREIQTKNLDAIRIILGVEESSFCKIQNVQIT
ncbi:formylmethanofuran dehydrogenase subunit E family protein [Desulfosporosinus sp.]|uniref:formylmethanofuran dehydrogenase subunit E family protein n=1 Tax=Desulfosporosinus sp. TaxID=157907 RepID=UPI00230A8322|nr:formylmethanofuran dehydrogenase subunit E family protein [Desulfosporosinus sp.]MCO5386751.1 formylmethanofuran dehydrogenase subunit E family protein [Desulfosporosinus sp.]MDA8222825.1 formylmethanofuran dehydrogenase subunit E family protein [Desulfitobacterium hafniense]